MFPTYKSEKNSFCSVPNQNTEGNHYLSHMSDPLPTRHTLLILMKNMLFETYIRSCQHNEVNFGLRKELNIGLIVDIILKCALT